MFWTWDSYRGQTQAGVHELNAARHRDPLSEFFWRVDLMLYIAAAALAASVIALFLG